MAVSASERREEIIAFLKKNMGRTISASALAQRFGVSRQIIVGDIALLRAGGIDILATARGYRLITGTPGIVRTITCRHTAGQLEEELYAIVDNGGAAVDISVEHPVYGVLTAPLHIYSRYDVDELRRALSEKNAAPLLTLADGVHSHTVSCPDEETFNRICAALAGILLPEK